MFLFNTKKFIQELTALKNRQAENETKAALLIIKYLQVAKVSFKQQFYFTFIPKFLKSELLIDGRKINALPTSFVSGKINKQTKIISSLISSQPFFYQSNINFNPKSSTISKSNHYFAPSFAVAFKDILKIKTANKIKGVVKVKKYKHRSQNIIIGNLKNPQTVIFSHYDSIGPGAVDNASGVALSLDLILNHKNSIKENLFVIAGNEEFSYDQTVYWGHGYRVFEKKYFQLLKKAKRILVLDCLGYDNPILHTNPSLVKLGFPIKNLGKLAKKITMLSGSFDKLMPVYHSELDLPHLIKKSFYQKAIHLVLKIIQGK